jgi:hypothetical protein
MIVLRKTQDGNRISLTGNQGIRIDYEVVGFELSEIQDDSFMVWHLLPHALKTGTPIHVEGRVDPLTIYNAEKVTQIWEMWQPSLFKSVSITADEIASPSFRGVDCLTFFSGGVDSTHMIINNGVQRRPAAALNVHGMEYNYQDTHKFNEQIKKTDPILEKYNYFRVTLRTNAKRYATGHHAWGMALAGHAHFFNSDFSCSNFASDYSDWQDFMNHPWGLNHVTNALFSSSSHKVNALDNSITRGEKLLKIIEDKVAVNSISFCKEMAVRPENCGACNKCLRTKVLFFAATGSIPSIFIDQGFDERQFSKISINDRMERLFIADAYRLAKISGNIEKMPYLENKFEHIRRGRFFDSAALGFSIKSKLSSRGIKMLNALRRTYP